MVQAAAWRWSSLHLRQTRDPRAERLLHPWPIPEPADWVQLVNEAQTNAELAALRRSVVRGSPYGSLGWQQRIARRLGLEATLRSPGRPKKEETTPKPLED